MLSFLNSAGSSENASSSPLFSRDSVMCFSIRTAPSPTATSVVRVSLVWSERPTGTSNFSFKVVIADKLEGFKDLNVTRLAQGVPIGGELHFLDENTLNTAFESRKKIF